VAKGHKTPSIKPGSD